MNRIKKRIISMVLIGVICTNIFGMYSESIYAGILKIEKNNKSDIIYTVLLLDLGGGMYMNNQSETGVYETYVCKNMVDDVKHAAVKYVEASVAEGRNEQIAVISYAQNSTIVSNFSSDANEIIDLINKAEEGARQSNIKFAFETATSLFESKNIDVENKNIINFTKGFCGNGYYMYSGKYSVEDCSWYNGNNLNGYYLYANAAYNTFSLIEERYNIYTVYFKQAYDTDYDSEVALIDFSKRFSKDIQNSGYIEVDNVDNLMFDFDGWNSPIVSTTFKFASVYARKDVEATCYYSDSYFENPSTEYNEHLATMSLCLELSTWSSYDEYTIWTNSVNNVFPKFQNARYLLSNIGFQEFAVNEFWDEAPTMDSIGAVAANKELPDGSTLIALAVRGGGYGKEWASNFTVGLAGEHAGFSEARDNVVKFLYDYIVDKEIEGEVKLWVVGYSRGGAVANLTAAELSYPKNVPPEVAEKVTWNREDVYGYTFEAPQGTMVINKILKKYNNINNIRNISDLVTYVGPSKWGFSRFGTDKLLPSWKYLGDNYYSVLRQMNKYLNQFEQSEEEVLFNVQEKVLIYDIEYDVSKLLLCGNPMVSGKIKYVYTEEIVSDSIDCLAEDIIGNRESYYFFYEKFVRECMSVINEESDERVEWTKFSTAFAEKLTVERIVEIASPLIVPNLDSQEVREVKVKNNIEELIYEVLVETECTFSMDSVSRLVAVLPQLLYNVLNEIFVEYLFFDFDKVETIISLICLIKAGVLMQPHYPEYTLAWMMQRDSYYGENDSIDVGRTYRVIHINCPVDVNVYSEDSGRLVASIIDDIPQEIEGSYIGAWVNDDEEKNIILPADTNYRVDILAKDEGTFNFTIDEYSYDEEGNTRIINYYDIPIVAGELYTANIPAMNEDELYSENIIGSTVIYSLKKDNVVEIPHNSEMRGVEAKNANYKVDVVNGNEYGYVLGGGEYSLGSFAKVTAYPMLGGEFVGWYNSNNELVSTEELYRFAVKEDVTLSAVFLEIPLYEISFASGEGGNVTNIPITVPEGVSIQLEAVPMEGYEFEGWYTSGQGIFVNSKETCTSYIAKAENVIIEARYKNVNEMEQDDEIVNNEIADDELEETVDINTGRNNYIYAINSMLISAVVIMSSVKKRKR